MAFLKKDVMDDFQKAVLAVELQADDCWKQMRLLKCPRNLATWALLTSMALKLELLQQEYGPDSVPLRKRLIYGGGGGSRTRVRNRYQPGEAPCSVQFRWFRSVRSERTRCA